MTRSPRTKGAGVASMADRATYAEAREKAARGHKAAGAGRQMLIEGRYVNFAQLAAHGGVSQRVVAGRYRRAQAEPGAITLAKLGLPPW